MSTSERKVGTNSRLALSGRARDVSFGDDTLVVDLEDGRQIAVPLAWFPRLVAAGPEERSHWELVGRGIGISWPDIDEDISVESLLATRGEDWLVYRDAPAPSSNQPVPAPPAKVSKVLTGSTRPIASKGPHNI